MIRRLKIIMAVGASGGHVIPALQVARTLRQEDHAIQFVGPKGMMEPLLMREGFSLIPLPARGLTSLSPWTVIHFGWTLMRAMAASLKLLNRQRPDVVMGFGSYGAFPMMCAAALLGYPTIIHEQNVIPGRANRWLAGWVSRVAVSFPETQRYFPQRKTMVTGCPCRMDTLSFSRETLLKNFRLDPGRSTLLILGGSQGSHRINVECLRVISLLQEKIPIQVIHVTGSKDYLGVDQSRRRFPIPYRVYPFLEDLEVAYKVADLVIARSGAVTISEMFQFQKPCVLIPYPQAQGHQKENAMILCRAGVAQLIEEKDLSSERLRDILWEMLKDPLRWKGHYTRMSRPERDASALLAEEALRLGLCT